MSVQLQQLINLFLLLLLGYFFSNLYLQWYEVGMVLFFTFIFDIFLFQNFKNYSFKYTFSSLITAMGIMLMMIATQFWIYFFVIAFALIQKKYLHLNGQHIFNPSNFALIFSLLIFYDNTHIVLGQLGDELWLRVVLMLMATVILIRVYRWIVSLSFTVFYLFFQYIFIVKSDPVLIMEEIYHRFYSVSFILFIVFMLTDPRTTPSKSHQQIFFALLIAFSSSFCDYYYGFRVQHLFMSLFLFSFINIFFLEWKKREYKAIAPLFFFFILITSLIIIENRTPYYFIMDI